MGTTSHDQARRDVIARKLRHDAGAFVPFYEASPGPIARTLLVGGLERQATIHTKADLIGHRVVGVTLEPAFPTADPITCDVNDMVAMGIATRP